MLNKIIDYSDKTIYQSDKITNLVSIATLIYHTVNADRGKDELLKEIEFLMMALSEITTGRIKVINRLMDFAIKTIQKGDEKYLPQLYMLVCVLRNARDMEEMKLKKRLEQSDGR